MSSCIYEVSRMLKRQDRPMLRKQLSQSLMCLFSDDDLSQAGRCRNWKSHLSTNWVDDIVAPRTRAMNRRVVPYGIPVR
jgi:hypothetical protein